MTNCETSLLLLSTLILVLGLLSDGNGVVLSVFHRDDLVEVEENLAAILIRRNLEAFHLQAGVEKPHHGGCHLFAEVCGDEEDALAIAHVDVHVFEIAVVKEIRQVVNSGLVEALVIQVLLIDFYHIAFGETRAVRRIFDGLPSDILSGVIQLVLYNDQVAALIDSKQIQAFFSVGKAVELLLDNEQVFPEGRRLLCNPFLKVMALNQTKGFEGLLFDFDEFITVFVDYVHKWLIKQVILDQSLKVVARSL